MKLDARDILIISTMPFHGMWTRKQRLAKYLASHGNRVLYVEPPHAHRPLKALIKSASYSLRIVEPNLWTLSPPGRLPAARYSLVRTLNQRILTTTIRRTISRIGLRAPVIIVYSPVVNVFSPISKVVDAIHNRMLVYDCVDDHSAMPGYSEQMAKRVAVWEQNLVERSDLMFVTSRNLQNKWQSNGATVHYSPNGVDLAAYRNVVDRHTGLPADLSVIPKPRIGFVGGIHRWIDLGLVRAAAVAMSNTSFVLIGPVEERQRQSLRGLVDLRNVFWLGEKQPHEIPVYLSGLQCGISPFKDIPLSQSVNPLKVYEYLAAGLPVVSTPMLELDKFAGAVTIASNPSEFIAACNRIVGEGLSLRNVSIEKVLLCHDWEYILHDFVEHLNASLQGSKAHSNG